MFRVILANKEQGLKCQASYSAGGSMFWSVQGGQHPKDIDYRARGLLQPYESLKAATPGPARARNIKKF